ncbi:ribbon-helix-helix domain-containing protein [Denitromonas halophila]|uniref:DNA-binding protein n=1 Tax=Denitromonas halophila TaxID=1629404 RepID=A0A557QGH9_9RHOO|nr:ribbon-helix-helix domain-containing protein [Denitromonas halophila]TVO52000.1 DNA-binding protein [Denitromonas halophila]
MCNLYSGQDPANYETVKRSVRLNGHVTSVALERQFWDILERLAATEGFSLPQFLARLYDELLQKQGDVGNFSSLLRVACTIYLSRGEQPSDEASAAAAA